MRQIDLFSESELNKHETANSDLCAVSSRLSFEEMVWNKRFPDKDFDADSFYDWAAENGKEAFYVCIDVARDLGL